MNSKVLLIAFREFKSTAMTKGFLIGAFLVPAIAIAVIPLIILLMMNADAPVVHGELAVQDKTGSVIPYLRDELSQDAMIDRRKKEVEKVKAVTDQALGSMSEMNSDLVSSAVDQAIEQSTDDLPMIRVRQLDQGVDLVVEKEPLKDSLPKEIEKGRIGLAVIDADAVMRAEGEERFGGFSLFVRPKLDDRVIKEMRSGIRDAIRTARYKANGYEAEEIAALTSIRGEQTQEVTDTGDRRSSQELTAMLPFAFMLLMMISVMVGGQYLLTSTIEEKSSRVVEVVLSAVSPMQLMTGKIIGQMCVGMTLLFIYSGLGMGALSAFALSQVVEPVTLIYLFVFFVLAYFMIASLMAAVGAAVNDIREAQSLQTPIILLVMLPYILWMPISRDPNSMLATVLSFVPPVSPFVMMMRITSTEPPHFWQILVSILVGVVGVYLSVRLAAKVFRVGLLMFGKPPNIRTLIRWIRMA